MSRIPLHGLQRGKDTELDFEKTASTRAATERHPRRKEHTRIGEQQREPHRTASAPRRPEKKSQPGSLAGERPVLITSR